MGKRGLWTALDNLLVLNGLLLDCLNDLLKLNLLGLHLKLLLNELLLLLLLLLLDRGVQLLRRVDEGAVVRLDAGLGHLDELGLGERGHEDWRIRVQIL